MLRLDRFARLPRVQVWRLWLALLALSCAAVSCAAMPREALAEAKVHALVVCDTLDEQIGEGVRLDRAMVERVVRGGFANGHSHRLSWTLLEGKNATVANVLAYYENLKSSDEDTIFFFYSGHGGMLRDDHLLAFDERLRRSDLRGAIHTRPHRLALIVSDCCANYPETPRGLALPTTEPANWETIEALFFRPSAMVDVTAASPGEVSGLHQQIGSFFVSAFCHLLSKQPKELAADGALDWRIFVGKVGRLVATRYAPEPPQNPYFFYDGENPSHWLEKTLVVKNDTDTPIRVGIRYLTKTDSGEFSWLTPNGTWSFEPGEIATLRDPPPDDFLIRAAAISIWAQSSDGGKIWGEYQNKPLKMIDYRFGYAAPDRQQFLYVATEAGRGEDGHNPDQIRLPAYLGAVAEAGREASAERTRGAPTRGVTLGRKAPANAKSATIKQSAGALRGAKPTEVPLAP
jgi:hypothetical protein